MAIFKRKMCGGYQDAADQAAECTARTVKKKVKLIKKTAMIGTPIAAVVIAFIIFLNAVIIPSVKYHNAVALMDAGKMVEAYEALTALDGYKDSAEKADSIFSQYFKEKNGQIEAGNYVAFGNYEQDNDTSNGKEDIEWLVLDMQDGKALVISKYALDCQQYNVSFTSVTWETCTLRSWLNDDFINTAFSAAEQARILAVTVSADQNPSYNTDPGNVTQDKIFLLSLAELNKYFSSNSERECRPTVYTRVYVAGNGNCWWWLRSPGDDPSYAAAVGYGGGLRESGIDVVNRDVAVRPAMWIEIPTE